MLGIAVGIFLGLFALDAFTPGQRVIASLPAFAIHFIPALVVLVIVALAWRRAWLGALTFIALAAAYAVMVPRRLDWIAAISGPLLLVGLLFLVSWRRDRNE